MPPAEEHLASCPSTSLQSYRTPCCCRCRRCCRGHIKPADPGASFRRQSRYSGVVDSSMSPLRHAFSAARAGRPRCCCYRYVLHTDLPYRTGETSLCLQPTMSCPPEPTVHPAQHFPQLTSRVLASRADQTEILRCASTKRCVVSVVSCRVAPRLHEMTSYWHKSYVGTLLGPGQIAAASLTGPEVLEHGSPQSMVVSNSLTIAYCKVIAAASDSPYPSTARGL